MAPNGTALARAGAKPRTTGQANGVIASILDAAHRHGLMVIQTVEGEVIERWYGGRPLLCAPTALDPQVAEAMVREAGLGRRARLCRASRGAAHQPHRARSALLHVCAGVALWHLVLELSELAR